MNDKQYTQEMIKNLNNRLKTKQEALTFDDTPTEGSVNPVTSEGVKAYADASKGTTYTAGENVTISENNVISAVDTKFIVGDNITISGNNVISATDTKYTAGTNITISQNNVISSTTDVSGTDDGTNWTSLTINDNTKAIPQGVEIEGEFTNEWVEKTWTGLTNFNGYDVWTDGENVYYSNDSYDPGTVVGQYILDKNTSTWTPKTWTGLTDFGGAYIWTDGNDVYYSRSSNQYVLNKSTSTWSTKTWNGYAPFLASLIWTDGENIYYSSNSVQYVLNKSTSTWTQKTWSGLNNFDGNYIWTDGENVYYSNGSAQYVLNKSTSTWSTKTWTGQLNSVYAQYIWTDGENVYYSNFSAGAGTYQYVLNKSTSTWSTKTWNGFNKIRGSLIWTDGKNIYYSYETTQYRLKLKTATVLAKVAETGDYSDLKNKPIVNPTLEGSEENLTGLEVENIKYKVPEVKISYKPTDVWTVKNWKNAPNNFYGNRIWTDGENIYYSDQYVLDKSTSTWSTKTWNLYFNLAGYNIWTDGENVYYSYDSDQYVLDKSTSTWSAKTWSENVPPLNYHFSGSNIWTDGENIYLSYGNSSGTLSGQYVYDKTTSRWASKWWNGLNKFTGYNVWTDGENIYFSNTGEGAGVIGQYVLDKATSTWTQKTWTGLTSFDGYYVWKDGDNVYYSYGSDQYVLDKATSTWSQKTWTGLTNFSGPNVWNDGENIYYSANSDQYVLDEEVLSLATVLAKVSETGNYNDLKNKPVIPNDEHLYIYSIEVGNGTDTIAFTNIQTSELLQSSLIFDDLVNLIQVGSSGVGDSYATLQGSLGFVSQKSNTQFTLLTEDGNSHIFASTDTLTITSHLEKTIF